jgi:hypothetical protein
MNPNGFVEAASIASPQVDAQVVRVHRELVDQNDIDVAERVLDQLGQLGLAGRRHRHGVIHDRVVEGLDHLEGCIIYT